MAPGAEVYSRWQRAKYYLFIALIVMALLGANWIGVFDPMAMLYRSTVTTVVPALQSSVEDGTTAIYDAEASGRGTGSKLYLNQGDNQFQEVSDAMGVRSA